MLGNNYTSDIYGQGTKYSVRDELKFIKNSLERLQVKDICHT